MKTGHGAELYPGHTKDSYSHLGHDLCILPLIYLFSFPHTPMSTCTHAPEDLGMFSYSVSWRQVLRIEKEMSKGGCRAGQVDSSSLAELAPSHSASQRHRESKPIRDSKELRMVTHKDRHRPTRSAIPCFLVI